jgi:membrane protein DedA with SNARE-associated domain
MVDMTILFVLISYFLTFTSASLQMNLEKGGIFDSVTTTVSYWIAEFGYPAVFIVALLENLFPPIPSEIIFPLVGFVAYDKNLGIGHAIGMGLVGGLGSTVGAIIIYYVALKIGKPAILRFGRYVRVGEQGLLTAESWFQKYGSIAVFSGRMAPGIRELISIPAGIGRMNIIKFVIFTFAGSAIWSVALTLLGYFLGDAWTKISEQLSSVFSIVAVIIVIIVIAVLGLRYYYGKRNRDRKRDYNNYTDSKGNT